MHSDPCLRPRNGVLAILLAAVSIVATTISLRAAADEVTGGPLSLLITYRSAPADRPAFRTYLQKEGREQLAKLQREGAIKGYQILFNPFAHGGTWDAMTVVSFSRYIDTQRWMTLEQTAPGGLTGVGLRLVQGIDTYSADLTWQGEAEQASHADGIYYAIPYEYGSAADYEKYVEGYVLPQVKGWMREGVLSGYRIFLNRYPVGRPWDALFIYEYRDLEAFGQRAETVSKVRRTLENDAEWKQFHAIKHTLRSETENTIAVSLGQP
jgi:DNA-binding Lrp family transcriptional regulator